MARDKIVKFGDGRMMEYQQVGRRSELVGVRRLSASAIDAKELASLKEIDLIAFSIEAERNFLILLSELAKGDGVAVRVVRAEAAFRLGISTETAKRYIEKYCCALSSPFEIVDGKIRRKEGKDGK